MASLAGNGGTVTCGKMRVVIQRFLQRLVKHSVDIVFDPIFQDWRGLASPQQTHQQQLAISLQYIEY